MNSKYFLSFTFFTPYFHRCFLPVSSAATPLSVGDAAARQRSVFYPTMQRYEKFLKPPNRPCGRFLYSPQRYFVTLLLCYFRCLFENNIIIYNILYIIILFFTFCFWSTFLVFLLFFFIRFIEFSLFRLIKRSMVGCILTLFNFLFTIFSVPLPPKCQRWHCGTK